jgi:hypothetical protein
MRRKIRTIEKGFVAGQILILLFMMLHDWIPLGPFNDLAGIRSQNTVPELLLTTAINTGSVLVVLTLTLWFIGKRYPVWARIWLVAHLGGILWGAVTAWWIPYFFGADKDLIDRYQVMFGNTHSFLPEMNGIVPNTIHVLFHCTLVMVWFIAIYLSFQKKAV